MSLCKDCFSGVRHEGSPSGNMEQINGVGTYVAIPEGDFPKDKAVLILTDVYGVPFNNNKLLVDDFARNGFQVYMPDMFNGDPVPITNPPPDFDRAKWMEKNSIVATRPPIDNLIAGLRQRGITTFGVVGYCFGAKHVIDLAKENAIASAAVAHPSRLSIPGDFNELVLKSNVPLLINSGESDYAFTEESCHQADEILGNGKYTPGYSRQHWLGCMHGFAVRGDMSIPQVKAGKEGAFKATVEWFMKM